MTGPTRCTPPVAARSALLRARLVEAVQARWHRRLVVVTGGAGFGKTTLLAQAVAENRLAPQGLDLWLTCGPDDATASTLAAGLRTAVGLPPAGDDRPAAVAADVAESLLARAPTQVALILDDVHEIPADSPGAELLAAVLDALPANGHLVLGSRSAPPFPVARLDAHGHVARVGEEALAFTDDELGEFATLRDVPGDRLGDVHGWPALAELRATAGAGAVEDFVWEEVLAALPADRRALLARLALLPRFDAELLAVVAEVSGLGSAAGLDIDAVTADLPLVLAGPDGERMLHPLWAPPLERELTADEADATRRRAAAVLAGRGDASGAMRLLAEAGAWDEVRRLIVRVCSVGHPPVPADVLASWLRRLPDDVRTTPEGRLLGVLAARPAGAELAGVATELEALAATFRDGGDDEGELAAIVQLGYLAWWRERHDILIGLVGRVFELESRGHVGAGPLAAVGRAVIADTMADPARVIAELDAVPANALNVEWQSIAAWLRSMSLLTLGYPDEALPPAEAAAALAAGPVQAPAEGSRLHARWFAGHIDEVLTALPRLVDAAEAGGVRGYLGVAVAQACLAFAIVGDLAAAEGYQARAQATRGEENLLTAAHLAIAEASLRVLQGDEARAAELLADQVGRVGLLRGLAASAQTRTLPLWYVLHPEGRPTWDALECGPSVADARALARAVVALREPGAGASAATAAAAVADLAVPAPAVVRAHLPMPWAALVATGLLAAGRPEGDDLLEALWPVARPVLRVLAEGDDGVAADIAGAARQALARMPAPPAQALSLQLLGPIDLTVDGQPAGPEWRRERVRTLLAYLAVHRQATRERVGTDLWPDLEATAGGRNLRVTLTYLNRVLEPERAEGDAPYFVRQAGPASPLELHADEWLDVDMWRFEASLDAAAAAEQKGAPSVALAAYEEALALWRGDPLNGIYDEWALGTADRLRSRFGRAAVRCGELVLAQGDADRALTLAEQTLAVEPWSEPAHRLVVAAHLARHDRGTARRALDDYRKLLSELGAEPDDATMMLERLLQSTG